MWSSWLVAKRTGRRLCERLAESGSPDALAFAARARLSSAAANCLSAFGDADSSGKSWRRSASQRSLWCVRKTSAVAVSASHRAGSRRQVWWPDESTETYRDANHSRTARSRYSSSRDADHGAGEVVWPVARAHNNGVAATGSVRSMAKGFSCSFIFFRSSVRRRCASTAQSPLGSTRRQCSQSRIASLYAFIFSRAMARLNRAMGSSGFFCKSPASSSIACP